MASTQRTSPTAPITLDTPATVLHSPLPTPHYGAGGFGSFTITGSTRIAARPDTCVGILLTSSTWPSWNRWVRGIEEITPPPAGSAPLPSGLPSDTVDIHPGATLTFLSYMDPDSDELSAKPRVTVSGIEAVEADGGKRKGWSVRWILAGWPSFVLSNERVQEFWDDGNGGTEYYQWETFYGLMAPLAKMSSAEGVRKGSQAWMDGLKKEAESRGGQ